MDLMDLTDEQIKQGLRNRLKNLEEQFELVKEQFGLLKGQIELVKTALKAYGDDPKPKNLQINVFEGVGVQDNFTVRKDKTTVRARVEGLLADAQVPMTSKEIMLALNNVYMKDYTIENFSGNFSQTYRKPGSKIQQFTIPDLPVEYKYVYGLISWADGNDLKQEYLQRFLDKH